MIKTSRAVATEQEPQGDSRNEPENVIVLDGLENWSSPDIVSYFLDTIFADDALKTPVKEMLKQKNIQLTSFRSLLALLDDIFKNNIRFENSDYSYPMIEQLIAFARYKKTIEESFDAYNPKTKPNPKAVFWPNPKRDPSQSIFEIIPVVRNLGWITRETPVGSAGSCFASEIAYNLQERGFNYVVAEKCHQPEAGVEGNANPLAEASINCGNIFNTPGFRQLAEKAFGVRDFPKILLREEEDGRVTYTDPFRDGVFFTSPGAYGEDHPRHCAAIREALMRSEVFVITPGLNECWETIRDGAVISRNPRHEGFGALIRHRVLTVQENVSNLQAFIDIARAHNPELKIIISVSPVPFMATGRAREFHVMTANGHSKAVLRVAAEELAKNNRDVCYFPSYELVTSGTKEPWDEDQRHVSRHAVKRVMQLFDEMFVRTSS